MMDMWTDVFASLGKRTTGTKAGHFAILPPGWKGDLPKGVERIEAPTPYVWIIGRTQTNGPKDYVAVRKVQDGYTITPLSRWGKKPQPVTVKIDSSVDMKTSPLEQVNKMSAAKYFSYAADLMRIHAPHTTDQPMIARMKRLGIEVGKPFDLENATPVIKRAIEQAPASGLKSLNAKLPTLAPVVNGWQMNTTTMGVYGNYYLKRSIIAMIGLGANLPEDAIYPLNLADSNGKPMDGTNRYVLRFKKSDLPPVDAFWSITMYDVDGFQVANPLNRFAIGDRDKLKYNTDGSLDIYIQNKSPGAEMESNWLPAPKSGVLGVTMRLYSPRPSALDGRWNPPAVERVK